MCESKLKYTTYMINMKHIGLCVIWIFLKFGGIVAPHAPSHDVSPKCEADAEVCEFSLTVQDTLSMMVRTPEDLALHRHPLIIFPNQTYAIRQLLECDKVQPIELEDISDTVTLDGSFKMILTVNDTMPGPPIVVYEGQQVLVNVTNSMLGESLTMHWHGQHQMGTPWMDGTGSLSHCSIEPYATFTYRFIAHPTGTFWYHAHSGLQKTEGVFGALIVLPRPGSTRYEAELKENPKFDVDYNLIVHDFYHLSSKEISMQWRLDISNYLVYDDLEQCFEKNNNVDGKRNTFVKPWSVLINGKGWHHEVNSTTPENTGVPLEKFRIKKGQTARFRVINSGLALTLRISVDGHPINIIATDGFSVKSRQVESVIVGIGERYDFWIKATDPDKTGLYWIRAEGIEWTTLEGERVVPIQSKAILSYGDEERQEFPSSQRQTCTAKKPCELLNCPYQQYPPETHMKCVSITTLTPVIEEKPLQPSQNENFVNKFLHFHYATGSVPTINRKLFQPPSAPLQVFPDEPSANRAVCDFDDDCTEDYCQCTHILRVPTGRVLQLVFMVMAHNFASTHPIHLHGHSFQVVKIGYPKYDPDTGAIISGTMDINCPQGMDECKSPEWSNSSWSGGNIPGIPDNVIRKDTVAVPVGGYVVVRLETTNPGFWFLHCHMELHSAQGMALILHEGDIEEMPPTPNAFKTCGDFYWSNEEFKETMDFKYNKDSYLADKESMVKFNLLGSSAEAYTIGMQAALGLTVSFLVVAIIVCVVLVIKLRRERKGYTNIPTSDVGYNRLADTSDDSVMSN